jgi:hypothetical protein
MFFWKQCYNDCIKEKLMESSFKTRGVEFIMDKYPSTGEQTVSDRIEAEGFARVEDGIWFRCTLIWENPSLDNDQEGNPNDWANPDYILIQAQDKEIDLLDLSPEAESIIIRAFNAANTTGSSPLAGGVVLTKTSEGFTASNNENQILKLNGFDEVRGLFGLSKDV